MDFLIPDNFNPMQLGSFLLGILILVEFYKIYRLEPTNWKRAVNVGLYGIHLVGFYLLFYADTINLIDVHILFPKFFTTWSPLLRLHSGIAFYLILRNTIIFRVLTKKIEDTKAQYNTSGVDNV